MSPDSPEARLGRLETAVARLEQRTDDLATDVRTLAPLVVAVAEVKIAISHVEAESRSLRTLIEGINRKMDEDTKERIERQTAANRDSRNFRNTMIGVGVAAILSPLGTLLITVLLQGHGS